MAPDKFKLRNITILRPDYRVSCLSAPPEGEASRELWSNFHGFGADRTAIEVRDVRAPAGHASDPDFRFEVVANESGRELWEMHDGWLYRMKATSVDVAPNAPAWKQ